jgi:hypothetical protein
LPAQISPRLESKAFSLAPRSAVSLSSLLVRVGHGLGIFHSFSLERDTLCDYLTVLIRRISSTAGTLYRGTEDEAAARRRGIATEFIYVPE